MYLVITIPLCLSSIFLINSKHRRSVCTPSCSLLCIERSMFCRWYKNLLCEKVIKNRVEKAGINPKDENVRICEKRPLDTVKWEFINLNISKHTLQRTPTTPYDSHQRTQSHHTLAKPGGSGYVFEEYA